MCFTPRSQKYCFYYAILCVFCPVLFFTFYEGILDSNINIQWNSPLGLVIFQHTRTNCQNSPIFGLFVGYGYGKCLMLMTYDRLAARWAKTKSGDRD